MKEDLDLAQYPQDVPPDETGQGLTRSVVPHHYPETLPPILDQKADQDHILEAEAEVDQERGLDPCQGLEADPYQDHVRGHHRDRLETHAQMRTIKAKLIPLDKTHKQMRMFYQMLSLRVFLRYP